jgi:hypothetical protein
MIIDSLETYAEDSERGRPLDEAKAALAEV